MGNQHKVNEGRAMVVVSTHGELGKIVLNAIMDGLTAASTTIEAV